MSLLCKGVGKVHRDQWGQGRSVHQHIDNNKAQVYVHRVGIWSSRVNLIWKQFDSRQLIIWTHVSSIRWLLPQLLHTNAQCSRLLSFPVSLSTRAQHRRSSHICPSAAVCSWPWLIIDGNENLMMASRLCRRLYIVSCSHFCFCSCSCSCSCFPGHANDNDNDDDWLMCSFWCLPRFSVWFWLVLAAACVSVCLAAACFPRLRLFPTLGSQLISANWLGTAENSNEASNGFCFWLHSLLRAPLGRVLVTGCWLLVAGWFALLLAPVLQGCQFLAQPSYMYLWADP